MKRKNSQVIGRQSREVPPPSEVKHMTLYGTEMLTTFDCRTCGNEFLISEQYKGHEGYCCNCWNDDTTARALERGYNRKGYVSKADSDAAGNLESFLQ